MTRDEAEETDEHQTCNTICRTRLQHSDTQNHRLVCYKNTKTTDDRRRRVGCEYYGSGTRAGFITKAICVVACSLPRILERALQQGVRLSQCRTDYKVSEILPHPISGAYSTFLPEERLRVTPSPHTL